MTYKRLLSVMLTVIVVAGSCDENTEIIRTQNKPIQKVEITSLEKEPALEQVLNIAGFHSVANGRANDAGVEVDVDKVMKVVQEDNSHHTFTFKLEDQEDHRFSNLVIEELEVGYLGFILKYRYEGVYTGMETFTGSIERTDLTGTLIRTMNFVDGALVGTIEAGSSNGKLLQEAQQCLVSSTSYTACAAWGYKFAHQTEAVCLQTVLVIVQEYGDCPNTDPFPSNPGPIPPTGGGTYVPSTSGGSTTGSPTPVDDPDAGNTIVPIPGYKPKRPVVVIPDEWPGSEEGLPYEWWKNEYWLDENFSLSPDVEGYPATLTAEEKRLIKLYPVEAYAISKNAEKATEETIKRFGNNGLNDKSDAFRHAFLNAMNERDCGDDANLNSIAKLFSDAHESENPSNWALEKEMDLWNNNIGQMVGDVMFPILTSDQSLSDDVMTKVTDGSLRYLSPTLTPATDPNFWVTSGSTDPHSGTHGITSTTKVIPTNQ